MDRRISDALKYIQNHMVHMEQKMISMDLRLHIPFSLAPQHTKVIIGARSDEDECTCAMYNREVGFCRRIYLRI